MDKSEIMDQDMLGSEMEDISIQKAYIEQKKAELQESIENGQIVDENDIDEFMQYAITNLAYDLKESDLSPSTTLNLKIALASIVQGTKFEDVIVAIPVRYKELEFAKDFPIHCYAEDFKTYVPAGSLASDFYNNTDFSETYREDSIIPCHEDTPLDE